MTTSPKPDAPLRLLFGVDDAASRASFLSLAERFRPQDARGLRAHWVIHLDGQQPVTVSVLDGRCLVSPGDTPQADARLRTDVATWLELIEGRRDGIQAFMAGDLRVDGDLNLAVRFETMFRPGPQATRLTRTVETHIKGLRIESLVSGGGTPVLLIHGLGANKVSFLPTLDGLAGRYEVHAIDLPGFGRSDKPLPAGRRYSMPWFADVLQGYLARNRIRSAHVVGNSMGGRVALELALRHPRSVRSIVGLSAAVAFDEYNRLRPLLRLVQAHWAGVLPVPARKPWLEAMVRELFHDPSRVPSDNYRAAADEVARLLKDPRYRLALFSAARRLGVEPTTGRGCYWTRLERLQVPSYWIFGRSDRLVNWRYAARVERSLPSARVDLWDDVGHVPQFEVPDRTNAAVTDWLERIEQGH